MSHMVYTESQLIFEWHSIELMPKTCFCSQQHAQVAVCEAVCQFNAGNGSVIEL